MNDLRIAIGPTGNAYLSNSRQACTVSVSPEDWADFIAAVKAGKFDRTVARPDYRAARREQHPGGDPT